DGLIDAMNPRKELYGFTRLEEKLIGARRQGLGPQKIVQTMFDDVTQFMDGSPQHDDMTIVAVEVAL
ncbi:MAG: SpoIIE family protein phosphatase, partial [Anaerolineae bacterium]